MFLVRRLLWRIYLMLCWYCFQTFLNLWLTISMPPVFCVPHELNFYSYNLYSNYFQPCLVLHSYLMVLLHQSINRFCPSCFWLLCHSCLSEPFYLFLPLGSTKCYIFMFIYRRRCVGVPVLFFQFLITCVLSTADVYILYHVVLYTHSLPEWDILLLCHQ
jgi:hypothetical protein